MEGEGEGGGYEMERIERVGVIEGGGGLLIGLTHLSRHQSAPARGIS